MTTTPIHTATFQADDGVDFTGLLHREGYITLQVDDPDGEVDATLRLLPADVEPLADLLRSLKVAATA
jgi:hypothetical protein